METKPKFSLKDHLFNPAKVQKIADEIKAVHPSFDHHKFIKLTLDKFPELELKARIAWMVDTLTQTLPKNYISATKILIAALPPECDPTLSDNDFGDFIYAPYAEFVAQHGCTSEHLEFSLHALQELTTRFSAENAIRSFLINFPKETLQKCQIWCTHTHYHVRRLASEGTRPMLPWSPKINLGLTDTLPILEKLVTDPTRFVTRSVANHLNDLSKKDPNMVITTLFHWKTTDKTNPKELQFIIKHSLRTLIKKGHPEALKLMGVSPYIQAKITQFNLKNQQIQIGESLEFELELHSPTNEPLIVDYTLHFQSKSGKMNTKKTYKLTKLELAKNTPLSIQKRHPLRANMSTRTLYPGQHQLDIQINGQIIHSTPFELLKETFT